MTTLKKKAYGIVKFNGKEILKIDSTEIHKAISQAVECLNNPAINGDDFSSIKIEFNKRPINGDNDYLDEILAQNEVNFVDDSELVPQLGITWGELNDLNDDQVWTNAFTLANTRNRENYTGDEIDSIRQNFRQQYEHTKYFVLLNGRL